MSLKSWVSVAASGQLPTECLRVVRGRKVRSQFHEKPKKPYSLVSGHHQAFSCAAVANVVGIVAALFG